MTLAAPTVGLTWYFIKNKLYADADVGYYFISTNSAETTEVQTKRWDINFSTNYIISKFHSLNFKTRFSTSNSSDIDTKENEVLVKLNYELRY